MKVVFSFATRNRFWLGMGDQRVNALLQLHDPRFGETHAALALEVERLGDHPDREDAEFARGERHHR